MPDTAQKKFVCRAVRAATLLAQAVQREMITPALTKNDRSPVTVGDFASQAVIAWMLAQEFPSDALVAEESAAMLKAAEGADTAQRVLNFARRNIPELNVQDLCTWIDRGTAEPGDRFWTLDPIDGTKGFLRGEQYAVCLALVENGIVQVGAVGCPELSPAGEAVPNGDGALFSAVRGEGAWVEPLNPGDAPPVAIHVSALSDLRAARLLRSVEKNHTDIGKIDELSENLGIEAEPIRMDSQAKYAALATGVGEVMVRLISPSRPDYREQIWDQAAGSLIIEEAGGRVSDLDGKPLDFSHGRKLLQNRGVVATNGRLHEAVLAGLRAVGA